jgi:uncharacterized protein YcaQ
VSRTSRYGQRISIDLSTAAARRYLVERHLLAPPRSLPAESRSVLSVVDRLAVLQFDPLEVPGARNHDLVLHARISGYRRGWAEEWLYGPDRRLFEIYNKSLNMVPIDELPHYRLSWTRLGEYYSDRTLREHADAVADILAEIERRGPLTTADFAAHSQTIDWWWAPTRAARAVLEALFVSGRVGIARRDGNRRYYDLIERLVPVEILARTESDDVAAKHRLLSRYRSIGLSRPNATNDVMIGTGTGAERTRHTAELVDEGLLTPVRLEGHGVVWYVPASECLDAVAAEHAPPIADPQVTFLAPLDPFMWDRKLIAHLFGFEYLWEVYTPQHKRRWGYYVLPVLFGDRLVGRIEPRLERVARKLRVLGVWWETGFDPRTAERFVPAMRAALDEYMDFVGATTLEWAPAAGSAKRLFGSARRRPG